VLVVAGRCMSYASTCQHVVPTHGRAGIRINKNVPLLYVSVLRSLQQYPFAAAVTAAVLLRETPAASCIDVPFVAVHSSNYASKQYPCRRRPAEQDKWNIAKVSILPHPPKKKLQVQLPSLRSPGARGGPGCLAMNTGRTLEYCDSGSTSSTWGAFIKSA